MTIRLRRRNLVVWSPVAVPTSGSGYRARTQLARARRLQRWLRTGTLLAVIGVMRLAQAVWARQRAAVLVVAILLTGLSLALESELMLCCGAVFWFIAHPWDRDEGVGG
jgi:hypothetical protein